MTSPQPGSNSKQPSQARFWVVVPAAGIGSRMGADKPKQYLPLLGKTVLEWTLGSLLGHARISGVVVALAADDKHWENTCFAQDQRVVTVSGGEERCHSVLNGLDQLAGGLAPEQWVMVHDVARPCISHGDLDQLIAATATAADGLVLGAPVRDTMKQTDAGRRVTLTAERGNLWHAYTPQVFRLGQLQASLQRCLEQHLLVTDESSAMEQCGFQPQMVPGNEHNIKITWPGDLALAELILTSAAEE